MLCLWCGRTDASYKTCQMIICPLRQHFTGDALLGGTVVAMPHMTGPQDHNPLDHPEMFVQELCTRIGETAQTLHNDADVMDNPEMLARRISWWAAILETALEHR